MTGVAARQAQLVDWLKHPTGFPIGMDGDRAAMFTAQEIVDRSGLYESRRACLDDLAALRRRLTVQRYGYRWRYEGWAR